MRTIEVCLYKFDELSKDAKRKAMDDYEPETSFYWDEAYQTVKKFHDVFGTKENHRSWLEIGTGHIDDCILELTGFRLQKYLWNNFGDILFKNKYLKHGDLSDVKKPYHRMQKQYQITNNCPNKGKWSISYYSNIQKESSCVLTGVCYDDDLLDPIYKFLDSRNPDYRSVNFQDLLEDCFYSLRKSLENEDEYRSSDEAKSEDLIENEYEFDERGNIV